MFQSDRITSYTHSALIGNGQFSPYKNPNNFSVQEKAPETGYLNPELNIKAAKGTYPTKWGCSLSSSSQATQKQIKIVENFLREKAMQSTTKFNWQESVVDFMKLFDLKSAPETRRRLAKELGYKGSLYYDSASMNIWLRNKLLHEIAKNVKNEWQAPKVPCSLDRYKL